MREAPSERELSRSTTPWASLLVYAAFYLFTLGPMLFLVGVFASALVLWHAFGLPRPLPEWAEYVMIGVGCVASAAPFVWWVRHRMRFGRTLFRHGEFYAGKLRITHGSIRGTPVTNLRVVFEVDGISLHARASETGRLEGVHTGDDVRVLFTPKLPLVVIAVPNRAPIAAALGTSLALFAHPPGTRVADLDLTQQTRSERWLPTLRLYPRLAVALGLVVIAYGALLGWQVFGHRLRDCAVAPCAGEANSTLAWRIVGMLAAAAIAFGGTRVVRMGWSRRARFVRR
jgi:hypothetical protein